jgi:hypothetical protein
MSDSNSLIIRWQTPPVAPQDKWALVAAELKAHIKQATYKAFQPAGMFESRSVKEADGSFTIYARFTNGEVTSDDEPTTTRKRTTKGKSTGTTTTTRTRRSTAKPAAVEQDAEKADAKAA